jgi:hypothetical protein
MIPKSKVLSANRSYNANVKLSYASPEQSQTQSVVVNVGPTAEKPVDVKYSGNEPMTNLHPIPETYSKNPYSNLELPSSLEEYKAILEEKDRSVQALNLIIEIIKNNPLIVNKYIIAHHNVLGELVKLLSNSTGIEIIEKDTDIECCSSSSLVLIDKIFVHRGGETYNLKYTFPEVIRILDEHRISTKICAV